MDLIGVCESPSDCAFVRADHFVKSAALLLYDHAITLGEGRFLLSENLVD